MMLHLRYEKETSSQWSIKQVLCRGVELISATLNARSSNSRCTMTALILMHFLGLLATANSVGLLGLRLGTDIIQ